MYCIGLPILLYGLEPFDLSNTDLRSLDFVINRFVMKLFKTTSMEIVQLSQTYFCCFELPSVLLKKELKSLETSIGLNRLMNIITLAAIHRFSHCIPVTYIVNVCIFRGCYSLLMFIINSICLCFATLR